MHCVNTCNRKLFYHTENNLQAPGAMVFSSGWMPPVGHLGHPGNPRCKNMTRCGHMYRDTHALLANEMGAKYTEMLLYVCVLLVLC